MLSSGRPARGTRTRARARTRGARAAAAPAAPAAAPTCPAARARRRAAGPSRARPGPTPPRGRIKICTCPHTRMHIAMHLPRAAYERVHHAQRVAVGRRADLHRPAARHGHTRRARARELRMQRRDERDLLRPQRARRLGCRWRRWRQRLPHVRFSVRRVPQLEAALAVQARGHEAALVAREAPVRCLVALALVPARAHAARRRPQVERRQACRRRAGGRGSHVVRMCPLPKRRHNSPTNADAATSTPRLATAKVNVTDNADNNSTP